MSHPQTVTLAPVLDEAGRIVAPAQTVLPVRPDGAWRTNHAIGGAR